MIQSGADVGEEMPETEVFVLNRDLMLKEGELLKERGEMLRKQGRTLIERGE